MYERQHISTNNSGKSYARDDDVQREQGSLAVKFRYGYLMQYRHHRGIAHKKKRNSKSIVRIELAFNRKYSNIRIIF